MKMSMELQWNDTDRGKQNWSEKKLSHCSFVLHTSHMVRPGIEPSLCGERLATNHLNQGTKVLPYLRKSTCFRRVCGLSPCKCTMQECGALVDWQ